MKISTLIFLFIFGISFSQEPDGCKSSEMDIYENEQTKKWENYEFVPISKEEALTPPFEFISIDFLKHASKLEIGPDSISIVMQKYNYLIDPEFEKTENSESYMDNFSKFMEIEDSLRRIVAKQKIGPLSKPKVIKSEQRKNKWAILYYDFKYDELLRFGAGYWLAFSNDYGKAWEFQYTGLSEKNNFIFKKNSNLPLWKDDNQIQIEANIVRMTDPMGHPLPPEYEIVKDNALVIMDINEIIKDSDEDGINDITERKLFLNPNSSDTDNDGIPDNLDTNPRFKSKSSELTILYEGIMFGNYELTGDELYSEFEIDLENPKIISLQEIKKNTEGTDVDYLEMNDVFSTISMIVTDDKNLQQINPPDETVIILSKQEYEEFEKQNKSQIIQKYFSPLFKCDIEKDTFILNTEASYSGQSYKIRRTKKGWKVKMISFWIS